MLVSQRQAIQELLSLAPAQAAPFEGSEFPFPVSQALHGGAPDLSTLTSTLSAAEGGDVRDALMPALALAEATASRLEDRREHFLTDAQTRTIVFRGVKWRAGWAFVVGSADHQETVDRLLAREFMVFTAGAPPVNRDSVFDLGLSPVAPVLFAQLCVRYAMIWGQVAPGDDHHLQHFLEEDVPAVVVLDGPTSPLTDLLVLALMKLGVPAVVPPSYPYPYGRQVIATDMHEALSAITALPNLRVKAVGGRTVALPGKANPAHAGESFNTARRLGGSDCSLFACRQGQPGRAGIAVVGERSETEASDVGVLIELGHATADDDVCALVEHSALQLLSYLPGCRGRMEDGRFTIELAAECSASAEEMAEVLRHGITYKYPRLEHVHVTIAFDPSVVRDMALRLELERQERDRRHGAYTAPTTYYSCIDCQPFSLEHVCIVASDRQPMCGRDWLEIKMGALFGVTYRPYKRRQHESLLNEEPFEPGAAIDLATGEYEGVNRQAQALSHGRVSRVRLHSVRDFPPTSCGCFKYLAWWIPEVDGVAIMHRGYEGVAPGDMTWDLLANRAAGKQVPGVAGIGPDYLLSPAFLRGDGGWAGVVWITRQTLQHVASVLPHGHVVATEHDARDLEELRAFLRQRPAAHPVDVSSSRVPIPGETLRDRT